MIVQDQIWCIDFLAIQGGENGGMKLVVVHVLAFPDVRTYNECSFSDLGMRQLDFVNNQS